ncbi:MAG: SH3 domain-containing protein, partial [Thiobacillus sp.]|nr:SH3 domain-containing protein [Thiobacillus sp.]
MIQKPALTFLLAACLSAPAWAVDGEMLRDDSLRAGAAVGAATVGSAKKGSKVTILTRQGGWTQIRAGGKTGWVRLLSVRAGGTGGSGSLSDVAALTEKRDPNKVVATAGLRGLNEEELRKAQYDAGQMQQLESQAVSVEDARRFAAEGNLSAVKLAQLPAPKAKTTKIAPTAG